MTRKRYVTIPNLLSVSRFIFLPLLFFFLIKEKNMAFFAGYMILGSTDFFDGLIARRFDQKTEIGKTLDSFADIFFYVSSAYFLHKVAPQYLLPNSKLLVAFFSLFGLSFVVSSICCKKPIMMHTFLLKLNGVLVYFVILLSFFLDTTYLISLILIIYLIGFTEEIIIFLRYGEVDPDTLTVFKLIGQKKNNA